MSVTNLNAARTARRAFCRRRVTAAAYEWHNYGKTTIGNRSDIERVPIDSLRAFYRKYYQPDNVVLIIAGRFEEDKALELVNKYLGSIPEPQRELEPTYTEEPPQDGERYVELRRVGEIGSVIATYHMPAASHADWAPLSILASVMSEDKVGLLEKRLIETALASSVSARADNAHDPGLFFFSATPTQGNLDTARDELLATIDGLAETEFEEEAIQRAKKRSERMYEQMMVDAGRMSMMLSTASSLGDWRLLFLQRDRLQEVTVADVQRVAQTYFPAYNRTLGMFIPADSPSACRSRPWHRLRMWSRATRGVKRWRLARLSIPLRKIWTRGSTSPIWQKSRLACCPRRPVAKRSTFP